MKGNRLFVCKKCGRSFAKPRQAHVCVPGCSVDQTFAGKPELRRVYDAAVKHLRKLGPMHEDAVQVGVFLKRARKFAELRPKVYALDVWLILPFEVDDPRVSRRESISQERFAHLIKLRATKDVDRDVKGWLSAAFHAAG